MNVSSKLKNVFNTFYIENILFKVTFLLVILLLIVPLALSPQYLWLVILEILKLKLTLVIRVEFNYNRLENCRKLMNNI